MWPSYLLNGCEREVFRVCIILMGIRSDKLSFLVIARMTALKSRRACSGAGRAFGCSAYPHWRCVGRNVLTHLPNSGSTMDFTAAKPRVLHVGWTEPDAERAPISKAIPCVRSFTKAYAKTSQQLRLAYYWCGRTVRPFITGTNGTGVRSRRCHRSLVRRRQNPRSVRS
jgi:hypothetical protein